MIIKLKRFSKTGVWGGIKNLLFGKAKNSSTTNQIKNAHEKSIGDLRNSAKTELSMAKEDLIYFKKDIYINEYKDWFEENNLKLPGDILTFIKGCSKFFTKENVENFYKDWINSPEKFITEDDNINSSLWCGAPEFFEVFPFPVNPSDLILFDKASVLITEGNADLFAIYYDVINKTYGMVNDHPNKSLKEILKKHIDSFEYGTAVDKVDYTPAQKRVFENYRKLVIQPLK